MADPHANIETGEDTDVGSHGGARPRIPGWQKVVGIVGLVLLLLLGARMLGGGGLGGGGFDHGPGSDTPPADSTEERDQRSPDADDHNPFGGWDH